MTILTEGVPRFVRLVSAAFAGLGAVALVKTARDGLVQSGASWSGIGLVCVPELFLVSTCFLKVEISLEDKTKRLVVNRTGWTTYCAVGDLAQVYSSPVGGFLGSTRWAVMPPRGSKKDLLARGPGEMMARRLVAGIKKAIGPAA